MCFADNTKLKDKQVIVSESRGIKGILLIVDTCDSVSTIGLLIVNDNAQIV